MRDTDNSNPLNEQPAPWEDGWAPLPLGFRTSDTYPTGRDDEAWISELMAAAELKRQAMARQDALDAEAELVQAASGNGATLDDVINLFINIETPVVLLPIKESEKGPRWTGWTQVDFERAQDPAYIGRLRSAGNTGVLLGDASGGLCTIDCDTEALLEAMLVNSQLRTTLCTRGERAGQLWLFAIGNRPHQVHPLKVKQDSPLAVGLKDPKPDKDGMVTIGEWRAEGGQSVIRGTHPSGCPYTWPTSAAPITIDFGEIVWPTDIAIPWEKERKVSGDVSAEGGLLKRAIATLSVDWLWNHFGYPLRRTNPVDSPFRTDNTPGHPSFSVYDEGRRFKDHNSAYTHHRGDSFDFYQLKTGLGPGAAFVPFVELAGLGAELRNRAKAKDHPRDAGDDWQPDREEQEDLDEPDWEREVEYISIDELLAFDRANDPDSLIGNRFLCKGDTVVIQGETGIGKSVLVMQKIIYWAKDEPIFGIKAKRNLKSLLIESENNKGDLAEVFQDVTKAMGLSADQIKYLKTKIVIVRESAKSGRDFLKLVRRLIKRHNPDLVFADPLLSYVGDSVSDQKAMSAFLRNGLQPIVQRTGVIWFWVHHFGKPPRDDKPGNRRSVYSGLGSVEIAGWARETITVNVINDDEHLCEIEFGKRARRVGLANETGNPIYKIYIQQSKNGVLWDLADQVQAKKAAGAAAKYGKAAREIRAFIERKVNVTHAQLHAYAKQVPIGTKAAINIARAIIDDAEEPRIYEYKIKGRTNGSLAFSTVEQALNPLAYRPRKRSGKRA